MPCQWTIFGRWDNEREGIKLAFGKPCRPHLSLDKAAVIVCLDAGYDGRRLYDELDHVGRGKRRARP